MVIAFKDIKREEEKEYLIFLNIDVIVPIELSFVYQIFSFNN